MICFGSDTDVVVSAATTAAAVEVVVKGHVLERPSSGLLTMTLYVVFDARAGKSQVMLESVEAVTVQSADPTVTEGEDPKFDPVMSMVTAPDPDDGLMVASAGDEASA